MFAKKTMALFLVGTMTITTMATYADDNTTSTAPTPTLISAPAESSMVKDAMMPAPYGQSTYNVDDTKIEKMMTNSKIYKVVFDKKSVLAKYGLTGNVADSITSISLSEGEYNTTVDLQNGTINGWNTKPSYDKKGLTRSGAIDVAESFMEKMGIRKQVMGKLGTPKVSTNGYYGPMYAKDSGAMAEDSSTSEPIIEDDSNSDTAMERTYDYLSVTYPLTISGRKVVSTYGQAIGVRIDISNGEVSNYTMTPIGFKLVRRSSEKISAKDLVSFIERGGNSPYYGSSKEIAFDNIERVLVMHTGDINGENQTFLSTGFALEDTKAPLYGNEKYTQVVSDYAILNPSYQP